jgi:hypothetical protein
MSAFSRGLLFRPQCTFKPPRNLDVFNQVKSSQQLRSFSAGSTLQAAKKTRPQSAVKQSVLRNNQTSPLTKSTPLPKQPIYQSYASSLAQKGHPTLIYVAPSHTAFLISSYSAATFCFTYATYNIWFSAIHAPPDLATWVPIAFGAVCVGMSAMGTWLMLSPARVIRTITALPKTTSSIAATGKARPKSAQQELELEIELRKMLPLPFLRSRKIRVRPEDLVIRSPLIKPPDKRLTPAEVHAMRLQEEAEMKKALEYEQTHILSAPFRHMSRALFSVFKATARAWTREGFAKLSANGQTYKLDVSGGWALDGGRALDRLARLKPDI